MGKPVMWCHVNEWNTDLQHGLTIAEHRGLAKVIKGLDLVSRCAQALCVAYSKVEKRVTAASVGCLLKPFHGLDVILLNALASQVAHSCRIKIST
jgi:hypothetical protein